MCTSFYWREREEEEPTNNTETIRQQIIETKGQTEAVKTWDVTQLTCCMDCTSTPEAHQIVDRWFRLCPKNVSDWPLLCRNYFWLCSREPHTFLKVEIDCFRFDSGGFFYVIFAVKRLFLLEVNATEKESRFIFLSLHPFCLLVVASFSPSI